MPKLTRDIRKDTSDAQTSASAPLDLRVTRLGELLGMLVPHELGDVTGASAAPFIAECETYEELVKAWRKALYWTFGLDCTLSVMLASSATVMLVGEQLWFKIMGPPSSGKTTLIEGVATNKLHVVSKDTIRGFYSGFKDADGEDVSLAETVRGMTLATKDGDGLLQAPNKAQILAEGRGLYDRVGRTHYRNKVANDYEGHRMTWLLCGTAALREIDSSELGARFLDCVVMEGIDNEFEDLVSRQAAEAEIRGMRAEADGKPESHYSEELANAMMLTGGYLKYLRENCLSLMKHIYVPPQHQDMCSIMGKFIAIMRARPSSNWKAEDHEREFSPRLVRQMNRLAMSLALTLNTDTVNEEVMRRVHKVAMDTSRGRVLRVVTELARTPMQLQGLTNRLNEDSKQLGGLMRFLRGIDVVRYDKKNRMYSLSKYIKRLHEKVVGEVDD